MPFDNPIDELIQEHRDVEKKLELLEQYLQELEKKPQFDNSDRKKLTAWLDTFEKSINHHIDKEDKILFKALAECTPQLSSPMSIMEYEHRSVVSRLETFRMCMKEGITLTPGTLNEFCEDGFYLIDMLNAHLGKEEHILFPLANTALLAEHKNHVTLKFQELNQLFVQA